MQFRKFLSSPVSKVLGLFFIWKIIDLIVSLAAPHYVPYLGFFSYENLMFKYGMPTFIRALTNFDGIFYINISNDGYNHTEQAFFPLYPILISGANHIIGNSIISALLISYLTFGIGLFFLYHYLPALVKKTTVFWVLLFLFAYPTSYYFGVAYTESLFFMLFVGTLFWLKKRQYWLAALFAYCTSLTKVMGVCLLLPISVLIWSEVAPIKLKHWRKSLQKLWLNWKIMLVGLAAILGLLTYAGYLWATVHDPLYFMHAQESFGAHRSSKLITPAHVLYRYFRIFTTADHSFQYWIAVVEFIFYLTAIGLLCFEAWTFWQRWKKRQSLNPERIGLAAFSLANVLIPSLTGTLTAMPRYSLMSLTLYLVLAEIKNRFIKIFLLVLFILIHISFFALFIQGYYVT